MTTKRRETDVVVLGGGTSGPLAAIAAARMGSRTVLVEEYGFLGGVAVAGNAFHGFFNGKGEQIVAGIAEEIIQRLVAMDASPGHLRGGDWGKDAPPNYEYYTTPYDLEAYKYVMAQMCREAGVEILYHTFTTGPIMDGMRVVGVRLLDASGESELYSRIAVDATGDADIAARAGAEFLSGRESDGKTQNVTTLFRMGGVDFDRVLAFSKTSSRFRTWGGKWYTRFLRGPKYGEKQISDLRIAGLVNLSDDETREEFKGFGFSQFRAGEMVVNMTMAVDVDGTKVEDLTRAEAEEWEHIHWVAGQLRKHIEGCENSYMLSSAVQVGVRETRRIIGDCYLTTEDAVAGRKFSDGIAKGSYPLDIHDPKGGLVYYYFAEGGEAYDIPYGCLVPKAIDGLLVAGRSISCSHEALGSVRNQATVATLGHAAGVAAALSAQQEIQPRLLDVQQLRQTLKEQQACVDAPYPNPRVANYVMPVPVPSRARVPKARRE